MTKYKIFKYQIPITDEYRMKLPSGSKILSVSEQDNNIVMYALVLDEPELPQIPFTVLVIGTGNPIQINLTGYTFLGTVKTYSGRLMWHIFHNYIGR